METIFDHNVTKEELVNLFSYNDITKKELEGYSQRQNFAMIYNLYRIRGNKQKSAEYAEKIPNDINKLFSVCNHDLG